MVIVKRFDRIKEVKAHAQHAEDQIKMLTGTDTLIVAIPKYDCGISVYDIVEIVCDALRISIKDMRSGGRQQQKVDARTIIVYLIKKFYPKYGHGELADLIGYKNDHTMINHVMTRFDNMVATNDEIFLMKYMVATKALEKWLASE